MHEIIVITGQKDTGKTRLCMQLIELLRQQNRQVSGLVSPGLYQAGQKNGILVRDIASGEQKQLAFYDPGWDAQVPSREWRFDMQVVEWGNQRLKTVLKSDILVIDELGFLELEQNRGWTAGLNLLDTKAFQYAVVVVRPDLLETARLRWRSYAFDTVQANSDRDALAHKIMDYLRESA
jgi:nucleoside-triphosphatase THEP1